MESKKETNKQTKNVLKKLGAGRNKDADMENGLEDTGSGNGKLGRRKWHGHIYTTKCKIDS